MPRGPMSRPPGCVISKCEIVLGLTGNYALSCLAFQPWIDNNFGYAIFLVPPYLVHPGCFVERNTVRNDVAGVNLSLLDALE
jgi:hypothetical protein